MVSAPPGWTVGAGPAELGVGNPEPAGSPGPGHGATQSFVRCHPTRGGGAGTSSSWPLQKLGALCGLSPASPRCQQNPGRDCGGFSREADRSNSAQSDPLTSKLRSGQAGPVGAVSSLTSTRVPRLEPGAGVSAVPPESTHSSPARPAVPLGAKPPDSLRSLHPDVCPS